MSRDYTPLSLVPDGPERRRREAAAADLVRRYRCEARGYVPCPDCGGCLPMDSDDETLVCRCGTHPRNWGDRVMETAERTGSVPERGYYLRAVGSRRVDAQAADEQKTTERSRFQ